MVCSSHAPQPVARQGELELSGRDPSMREALCMMMGSAILRRQLRALLGPLAGNAGLIATQ